MQSYVTDIRELHREGVLKVCSVPLSLQLSADQDKYVRKLLEAKEPPKDYR